MLALDIAMQFFQPLACFVAQQFYFKLILPGIIREHHLFIEHA